MSEQKDFTNSESVYCSEASHQVSDPSKLRLSRSCRLKNLKMATVAAILDIGTERFKQFEYPCLPCASHQVTAKSDSHFGSRCYLKISRLNGGHLGYRNGAILAVLNLHVAPVPPTKFQLKPTYDMAGCCFNNFKMAAIYLGYLNRAILAILILHVAPISHIKFGLIQTQRSGADVVSRFSRWPPWWLSWISERSDFSNSESLCPLDAPN